MDITTDLLKFVTLRPAQLASAHDAKLSIVRDPRAAAPESIQRLPIRLGPRESKTALARWLELDLSALEPLARGQRELVRQYEALDAERATPPAAQLIEAARLADLKLAEQSKLFSKAWDALYAAHATGPDAGPRLEIPMAALRVLHFLATVVAEPSPAPATALAVLTARPAIAPALDEVLRAESPVPAASSPLPESSSTLERRAQVDALASDLHAADTLLNSLTNSPSAAVPTIATATTQPLGEWSRHEVSVSTTTTLRAALPAELTRSQTDLLGRLGVSPTTPVPVAVQTLRGHFTKLSDQAYSLADDKDYQAAIHALPGTIATPETAADVSVAGRITPLGIGDLKVVKQKLLAYVPGEVAHIENVLKGESNERKFRDLNWTETTISTLEEETRDTERDTQSTDRFELKREAEATVKEDMSIKAGLTVTATYGPVVATATGDFAYSTSKSDSQKSSSNFARDVVDRSISKVQTRTRTERKTITHKETEETTTHSVDNRTGSEHVIGVYRWVDKRYRAQVYNYGVRLMFEFVLPEPAAFYRATHGGPMKIDATPPMPFLNDLNPLQRITSATRLSASDISENNYHRYAARYGASGVVPPPPLYTYAGAALSKDAVEIGKSIGMAVKDFTVPAGYWLDSYTATVSLLSVTHPKFTLQVGADLYRVIDTPGGNVGLTVKPDIVTLTLLGAPFGASPGEKSMITGPVPVSVAAYDVVAFAVNVQGICKRTDESLMTWKLQTYEKILTAYQAQQTVYDQKLAQAKSAAGIVIEGRNPAANRVIEQTELKKLCMTMMTGQHFSKFHAMTDPPGKPANLPEVDIYEALDEGPIVQFFEQAFEWEQMTYLFYPYFWGRKSNWIAVNSLSDPDPLFQQFLAAGACRVLVPVPMRYVAAVQYMLQSKQPDLRQRIWKGGEPPTLDSDLYISIAQEMRNQTDDLAGATPEGDPWEYTLPTTLVWLQLDSSLPTFTV
jgi:hypothetical protein